jgi:hypothetical protein
VCHGSEADGAGARAETMSDAKPRMLTNLDWLETRDDLRLLRSIKYGVPGTAMVPWGDVTSSLQRLQLVIFIRSLSEEHVKREQLLRALYDTFDTAILHIEKGRVEDYKKVTQLQEEYRNAIAQKEKLTEEVIGGKTSAEAAADAFRQSLILENELNDQLKIDSLLSNLKNEVKAESEIYRNIGLTMVAKGVSDSVFSNYLKILESIKDRYKLVNGKLMLDFNSQKEEEVQKYEKEILNEMKNIKGMEKLYIEIISGFEQAKRLRQKELMLYEEYSEHGRMD